MSWRERELIDKITQLLGPPSSRVEIGIGDDACVAQAPRGKLVASVDMLVESVHFNLHYSTLSDVGWRAAAVGLSDIAAMAATPLYILVSLAIPLSANESDVLELYTGLKEVADQFAVDVVGGNISLSPKAWTIDVTVFGEAEYPIRRSGSRPEQWLAVTGSLGRAAAGLAALKSGFAEDYLSCVQAHRRPIPQLEVARRLAATHAVTAMMDVSDGLASDCHQLARASKCGFHIFKESIPIDAETQHLARKLNLDPFAWALGGGDDYQLLLTLEPFQWKEAVMHDLTLTKLVHVIGEADESGLVRVEENGVLRELSVVGWEHSG